MDDAEQAVVNTQTHPLPANHPLLACGAPPHTTSGATKPSQTTRPPHLLRLGGGDALLHHQLQQEGEALVIQLPRGNRHTTRRRHAQLTAQRCCCLAQAGPWGGCPSCPLAARGSAAGSGAQGRGHCGCRGATGRLLLGPAQWDVRGRLGGGSWRGEAELLGLRVLQPRHRAARRRGRWCGRHCSRSPSRSVTAGP